MENIIVTKSKAFAIRIIKLSKWLNDNKKEYVLSKQVLKSGTSIGANVHEAVRGQSKSDFIAKMSIALKESYETEYWLSLLKDSGYISVVEYTLLYKDNCDITNILSRIILSAKANCVQEK